MLLSIEKLIYGGDGLARTPGGPDGRSLAVFVPFVLPGERVEADVRPGKAGFARGEVTELIAASPHRVEPRCPYFRRCGGCHYQHIPYELQLEFKGQILRETLQRVAKIDLQDEIRLHPSPPWNYRNRTRLQVRTGGHPQEAEFALGYFRFGSREFLPVRECPISSLLINEWIARMNELAGAECPAEVEEIEVFADADDKHLLAWAFCGQEAHEKNLVRWAEALRRDVPYLTGVSFFPSRHRAEEDGSPESRLLARSGASSMRYRTAHGEYGVSAGAFFQVNHHLVDELVSVVISGDRGETACDLYAGVGLFSLPLATRFHHIFAVEASHLSLPDLQQNVPANVKVVGTRTEDYLRSRPARKRPDLVVLDPPRAGAGKAVTSSLVKLEARRVHYVSCDPATLARDLSLLLAAGYHIEEAHLFDLFPQTFHIESVVLLTR